MITIHKFNEQGQLSLLPPDSIHHLQLNNEDNSGTGRLWIDLEKSTIEEDELVFKKKDCSKSTVNNPITLVHLLASMKSVLIWGAMP